MYFEVKKKLTKLQVFRFIYTYFYKKYMVVILMIFFKTIIEFYILNIICKI